MPDFTEHHAPAPEWVGSVAGGDVFLIFLVVAVVLAVGWVLLGSDILRLIRNKS